MVELFWLPCWRRECLLPTQIITANTVTQCPFPLKIRSIINTAWLQLKVTKNPHVLFLSIRTADHGEVPLFRCCKPVGYFASERMKIQSQCSLHRGERNRQFKQPNPLNYFYSKEKVLILHFYTFSTTQCWGLLILYSILMKKKPTKAICNSVVQTVHNSRVAVIHPCGPRPCSTAPSATHHCHTYPLPVPHTSEQDIFWESLYN